MTISRSHLTALAVLLPIGFAATTAHAQEERTVVAGWDFSQYAIEGFLSIDGATLQATLPANYSDNDPTFGAGSESAAFGTMYLDGSFGSTAATLSPEGNPPDPFVPTGAAGGSLVSNLDAPQNSVPDPDVPFDSFAVLTTEGQEFAFPQAMAATAPVDVVFEADLPGTDADGGWRVSFAGRTVVDTSTVVVSFSPDGSAYAGAQDIELDTSDRAFDVPLSSAVSEKGYVKFSFDPASNLIAPLIDNVAITVPEPIGAEAAGALALVGLAARRRARRQERDPGQGPGSHAPISTL